MASFEGAVQDNLDNLVATDDFSDHGQVLVEVFRVRYPTQPSKNFKCGRIVQVETN